MQRFVTYETNCGFIGVLTEAEFAGVPSLDDHAAPREIADWVWQFADTKQQAENQHSSKVEAWQADPSKETY